MVAIVSGSSLGISLTSFAAGQSSLTGSTALGRTGQQVLVNSANGNLILQQNDDHLTSNGLDLFALRTYNSQGTFDGDGNDDNWRLGFFRSVDSLTGTVNSIGSTITRTDADGARAVYRYDGAAYITTDGAGAHDSINFDVANKQWRWTDGESRMVETYDWNERTGKLIKQHDASGNAVDFIYTGAQLTEVRSASGEKQQLIYEGRNLAELRTVLQDGTTYTGVRYRYDQQDRLVSVVVDLTPADGSVADGNVYATAYSYDGASSRIAGIHESDGTQASFTYQQRGAVWVISTMMQVVDGIIRTTSYDFGSHNSAMGSVTRITDALGHVTLVEHDSFGRLIRIDGPPGGSRQSVAYTYNAAGDVLSQTDAVGNVTNYGYDSRGNQTSVLDVLGHSITRTFGTANQLLTQKNSAALPGTYHAGRNDGERIVKFVYDIANRLRFTLSDDGRVTEQRFDAAGNRSALITYTAQVYSADAAEAELVSWVDSIADKSTMQRTDFTHDFRGQASTVIKWARVDPDGAGIDDGGQSITRLVYDQSGRLLQSRDAAGLVTCNSYDGMGRLLSATDNTGGATTVIHDDAGRRVVTRQVGGLVTTSVYNTAGELTSIIKSDATGSLGETHLWYDAAGLLRASQDADGTKRMMLYDASRRQVAAMDTSGRVTEYIYDTRGNRSGTIAYASPAEALSFMARPLDLADSGNEALVAAALALTLDEIRPAATPGDARTWYLYDAKDRLVWEIDALGFATQTVYDGQSRVVGTNRLATAIDVAQLSDGAGIMVKLAGSATSLLVREAAAAAGPNGARTYVAILGSAANVGSPTGTVSFFAGEVLLGSVRVASKVATLTVANLPLGESEITAAYSGDENHAASSATALSTPVASAPASTVALAISQAQAGPGEAVMLSATVNGASPAGMVVFYCGDTVVGYGAVNNGIARLAVSTLTLGQHRLTAAYLGDANNGASRTEASVAVTVTPPVGAPQTVRVGLTASVAQPVHGQTIVLRAEMAGAQSGGVVVFFGRDGKELGQGVIADGAASLSVPSLAAGKHALVAMYLGEGTAGGRVASVGELALEVGPAPTTISLDIPVGPRPVGSPLVLFANVAGPGEGFATGAVTFYNGASIIGRADLVNGRAAISVLNLPVGTNALSVRYGGDANNIASRADASSQVTVDAQFKTSITLTASKTTLAAGDKVVLTANVMGSSGEPLTGIVTFFSTREVLGTALVVNGVATLETAFFNTGYGAGASYPMAAYSGDAANGASSVMLGSALIVHAGVAMPAPLTSTSTLAFDVTPAAVIFGESSMLRVHVGVADSTKPATGAVTFFDSTGRNVLGSARVIDGVATLHLTALMAASQKIIAVYSGDRFNSPTSNAAGVSRTVTMQPVVVNPVLSASRIGADRSGVLRLTAAVIYPNAQLTVSLDGTAAVVFYAGDRELGVAIVTNGVAVLDVAQGPNNTAEIRAVFRSDRYALRATGSAAPVQLAFSLPNPPTLTMSASTNSQTVIGGPLTLNADLGFDFGGYGSVTGSVAFYDGDALLGTAAVSDHPPRARWQINSVTAGEHKFRAVYTPSDPAHRISYSKVFAFSAPKPAAALQVAHQAVDVQGNSVSWSSPSAQFGKVTVTFATAAGRAAPTGTVVLYRDGDARLGTVQVADGKAVFLVPASALRDSWFHFSVRYSGDLNTAPADKEATLGPFSGPNLASEGDDKVVLTSSVDPAGRAGMVELVASIRAADPAGTVIFRDAFGNVLGVSPVECGAARLVLTTPVGELAGVKATYTGSTFGITVGYSATPTHTGVPTATVLTLSENTIARGAPLMLTARVAGGAALGGTVTFYDGAVRLGTAQLQDGAAVLSIDALPASVRQLRAVYSGDQLNAGSTSGAATASIMGFPTNIALKAPVAAVRQGAPVTYTALVEGSMPGGVVTFLNGKTVLGTAKVVRGLATLELAHNAFDTGGANIVASYSGDEANASAVSAAVRQSVTAGTRQVVLGRSDADRFAASYDDGDGNVRVEIDAENFVTEYVYDAANRLVKTIAYAQAYRAPNTLPGPQSHGGFTAANIAANMPQRSVADGNTHFYYDNAGRRVADVNAEGYLSEYVYDQAGRPVETIRYANMARGPVNAASTLTAMRPPASMEDQRSTTTWDVRGRVSSQRGADGTVTGFTYDNENRVTGTTRARGTDEENTTLRRFDVQGYLKAELSALGAALIVGEQTVAEVDAIWSAHGTSYNYDAAGKLISSAAPHGQRIVFFHDDAGRLRHTVNALGEVTENSYDTLGRRTAVTRYAEPLAPAQVAAMAGGTLSAPANQAAALALQQARSAGGEQNSITTFDFDLTGQVIARTDAMRVASTTVYNAFGEVVSATGPATADAGALTTVRMLDRRGLETATVQRSDKLYLTASAQYDAFGRALRTVDASGNVRQSVFDRLGQVIQTVDPAGAVHSATYDATGRVLTATDALKGSTAYAYDTAARSNTVTSPEGVAVTTVLTRTGQVRSITDGNGNKTSYRYDLNGNVLGTASALRTSESVYDDANRLVLSTDSTGYRMVHTYDAASRVLTSTVDPDGANHQTRYEYDAKGQSVRVTDPRNKVTTTAFDLEGRIIRQTVDAAGTPSTTSYRHDATGRVVSVVQQGGARTDYVFDEFGRRTKVITDPLGLQLVDSFEYDKNGNANVSTDAAGNRTLYFYDSLDRLVYTVAPTGTVQQTSYDLLGRVTRTALYAQPIALPKLGANPGRASVAAQVVLTSARDLVTHLVYDKDGRVAFEVDAQGGVKAYQHDGNGNVVSTRTYANRIDIGAWVVGTFPAPAADPARDILVRTVYDSLNRVVYTVDALGQVTGLIYGPDGNVSERLVYANRISADTASTMLTVRGALIASARDIHERFTYDHAGRVLLKADTLGNVEGFRYDARGNVTRTVNYAAQVGKGEALANVKPGAADVATLMAYDAHNRMVLRMDATGQLQARSYDGKGNLVKTTTYATHAARPTSSTDAMSLAALSALVSPDPVRDRNTVSVFDGDSREVYAVDADGFVTARVFDAVDNVVRSTTYATAVALPPSVTAASIAQLVAAIADPGRDQTMRYVYDASGRVLWSVNAGGDAVHHVYSTGGQLIRTSTYLRAVGVTAPLTSSALASAVASASPAAQDDYVYDAAGRVAYAIDCSGVVTSHQYDGNGLEIKTTVHAARIPLASLVPGIAPPVVTDPLRDSTLHSVYDSLGRVVYTVDSQGFVLATVYSPDGNVSEQIAYGRNIDPHSAMSADAISAAVLLVADSRLDARSRFEFDRAGRVLWESGTGGRVTGYTYDAEGNLTKRVAYACVVAHGAPPSDVVVSAGDKVTLMAYDVHGRAIVSIDSAGRISTMAYDARGNLIVSTSFATLAPAPTAASAPIDSTFAIPAGAAGDRSVRMVYDAGGRETFRIDQAGSVVATRHIGSVKESIAYAKAVPATTEASAAALCAALAKVADSDKDRFERVVRDVDGHVLSSTDAGGRTTRFSYDARGNPVETVSPEGAVSRQVYDGEGRAAFAIDPLGVTTGFTYDVYGNVIKQVQFSAVLPAGAHPATLATPPKADDRVSLMAYDQRGNLLYAVGADGAVRRQQFDAAGNMTSLTFFSGKVNTASLAAGAFGVAAVAALLVADPGTDRISRQVFDNANRLVYSIDPAGYVQKYDYDEHGNVTVQTRFMASL